MRLAFARFQQESNALSPVLTTRQDFERAHYIEGPALLDACGPKNQEVEGFLKHAELSGFVKAAREHDAELVPLFSAWAITGGPIEKPVFDEFRQQILDGLAQSGPLDGFFLAIHGGMCVQGLDDPEGDLLRDVRLALGPDVPIAVSMDLHANLTRLKIDQNTLICAYRTNPHRDHKNVGYRAGDLLCRTVKNEVKPTISWRTLPLVLGGGTTMDFLAPMRKIYRWMKKQEKDPRVLYMSLFNCHLWLDAPELGWSTHIITDNDPELAERLAEELAQMAWDVRHKQPPEFPNASEAIHQARRARVHRHLGTVCMSDASDMVGAGGTGGNTALLAAFLNEGSDLEVLIPLRDPTAVAELWDLEPGAVVDRAVGGTIDPDRNDAVPVQGIWQTRHESAGYGKMVVVRANRVTLVLTEGAAMVMQPRFYTQLGLSPWRADVVVVKSLFPFRLYFALHNRKTIYAKTDGITDFDAGLKAITFNEPVWPKDDVQEWRPTDRRRRGVPA